MEDKISYLIEFENEFNKEYVRGIETDYAHTMTALCKDPDGVKFSLSYVIFTPFPDIFHAMLVLQEKIRKDGDKVIKITYKEMFFI